MSDNQKEIHEYILNDGDRPSWYIRLSTTGYWADFDIYSVCFLDESSNTLMFLPEGWSASPEDACPWTEKSIKTIDGTIKWDGCTEFTGHDHFCNGARDYAKLHAVIQFSLEKAHSFMIANVEWSPLDEDFLTPFNLIEVPREKFSQSAELLKR